jgi:hypothetical protein
VYRVLAHEKALGLLRVVDESGEDYLYPAHHFLLIHVPATAQRIISVSR